MDSFTAAQVQIMKLGGNQQCNNRLSELGGYDPKTTPAKEKYDNDIAQLYKLVLKARAEGLPEPTALPATKSSTPASSSSKPRVQLSFTNTTPPPSVLASTIAGYQFSFWPAGSVLVDHPAAKHPILSILSFAGLVGASTAAPPASVLSLATRGISALVASLLLVVHPCHVGHKIRTQRLAAFKSSVNDYTQRVQAGRAKRNLGYEVLLPPNVSVGGAVETALVFYPGVLVDHMAYAKILGQLSDRGVLVLLVSAEPCRIASQVATVSHLERLRHEISTLLAITVKEWVVGGHSLGGAAALALFGRPNFPKDVTRCVQWAIPGESVNLNRGRKSVSNLQSVMRISASNDGVTSAMDLGPEHARKKLPVDCEFVYHCVQGGNHAGFGHYGPQTFPSPDGDRQGITLDDQQAGVVEWTTAYLLKRKYG